MAGYLSDIHRKNLGTPIIVVEVWIGLCELWMQDVGCSDSLTRPQAVDLVSKREGRGERRRRRRRKRRARRLGASERERERERWGCRFATRRSSKSWKTAAGGERSSSPPSLELAGRHVRRRELSSVGARLNASFVTDC
jgi:hypothetical protein